MSQTQIYHNPRCSKSRATLAILEEQGVDTEIIKYLETPPTVADLQNITEMLGVSIREILRRNEAEYKDNGFANPDLSDAELMQMVTQHPKVLERPIVVNQGKAVVGRPPENVLDII